MSQSQVPALPPPCRIVRLWDSGGPVAASGHAGPVPLRWPDKPAAAVLDYGFDASGLLWPQGDVLAATVGVVSLQLVAQTIVGSVVLLWLAGGSAGVDNVVDLQLATRSGRFVRRIVRLLTL